MKTAALEFRKFKGRYMFYNIKGEFCGNIPKIFIKIFGGMGEMIYICNRKRTKSVFSKFTFEFI